MIVSSLYATNNLIFSGEKVYYGSTTKMRWLDERSLLGYYQVLYLYLQFTLNYMKFMEQLKFAAEWSTSYLSDDGIGCE